ncbi:hybrid-cluster NAD(P)-dependent oxidoreductase [Propionivibrio limicola]|uniref:hybrid-cluster NAD(P)-dependent oxidoreductase n=1 Tax=Propionivibrio limicola TaxID=167645 RepID=UPI0012916D7A|nr:hybrid-cluster NAD(P)-dependent oxidoreductase [Propionivibrio limicola]
MNAIAEHHLFWQGETPLTCISRTEETHDTATFELAAPSAQFFDFLPGQFVSVGAAIDGKTLWRAYSISSSPTRPETLSITVKRVAGGRVSNWLLDNVQPGVELPALAPAGDFALRPDDVAGSVALFSSGCGITPMMSMTRWLLENRADTEIHFFHSARSEDDFIFRQELRAMAEAHANLKLHLFLTQPQGRMSCHHGRLDAGRVQSLLPEGAGIRAYLCGQEHYMDSVSDWLCAAGVPESAIHRENFAPVAADVSVGVPVSAERFSLNVPAFGKTAEIAEGELLLDVLEREGLPIIGACRTGVCGSCKCKVAAGEVDSGSALPLTPEEIEAGYVLACSSVAKGDLVIEL